MATATSTSSWGSYDAGPIGSFYFKNTGTATVPAYTQQPNVSGQFFNEIGFVFTLSPALADTDADGDVDMVMGNFEGKLFYCQANRSPVVDNAIPDQTLTGPGTLSYVVPADRFLDRDRDTLTYSARLTNGNPLPTWLNFTAATRTFSGNPSTTAVTPLQIRVTAADGDGRTASDDFQLTLSAVNDAPVITQGASVSVTMSEDGSPTPFGLTLNAADADGDTLTWSIATPAMNGTATATGIGTSKAISYTPNPNFNGPDSFAVQVADGNGGTDSITVNVTVQPVNDPPTMVSAGGPYSILEGQGVTLSASATDPDGDTLSYSWDINGDGTFGDATGQNPTLSWTQLSALGINDGLATRNVKVRVTDTASPAVDSGATTLTINNAPPTLMLSGASSVSVGQTYTLNLSPNDPGQDTISSWTINWGDGSSPQVVSGNPSNVTHSYLATGNFTISATATDEDGTYAADNTVAVMVTCTSNPVVVNGNDSGAGSLRQAITIACPGSTITFANGINLITLTSGELVINKNLTIQGPGANLLTIQRSTAMGTPHFRIFAISNVTATISGLTMTNGNADGGGAGFINSGNLTVTDCLITGNTTSNGGAGFANKATLMMTGCTISNNSSTSIGTGGIWNLGDAAPTVATLINCTISGNTTAPTAGQTGGGIDNTSVTFPATVTLINCTVANNTVGSNTNGGGLYSGKFGSFNASIQLKNTIVANNTAPQVRQDMGGTITSQGFNLISDTSLMAVAGDLLSTNPLLAPLGNYGGSTPTHHLLPGSPAIDAGGAANDPVSGNPLTTDQRGFARPVDLSIANATNGNGSDIGAYEVAASSSDCTTAPANLTAWFPADANANDIKSGNVGTLNGTAMIDTSIAGRVGAGAFSFPGLDAAYVSVPDNASLNVGTGDFSLDAWIKLNDADKAPVRTIQDKRINAATGAPTGYHFFVAQDFLGIQLGDGTGYSNFVATTGDVADGNWHHVTATVDRDSTTGGKLYVDGALVLTFNPTARAGSLSNSEEFRIGGRHAIGSANFKGYIDEVELFTRVLTQAEVLALSDASYAGKGKCYANLALTKTDNSNTAVAGNNITYTIQITNNGRSDVTGASVTDNLPASLSGASWTCTGTTGASCTAMGSGNISDTVTIPAGGNVTYTLQAILDANATGMLENTASVAAPSGVLELDGTNNSQKDTDTILIPTTTTPLMAQTLCAGGTVQFSTTASGSGPFMFVWKKGTTVLMSGITNNANTSMLTLTNVQVADSDTYSVEVTGAANAALQSAPLMVNALPPTPMISGNLSFCTGGSTTLTATGTGTFMWFKDNMLIPGQNSNMLTVTEAGSYTVKVTDANSCASATSQPAVVTVNANPIPIIDGPMEVCANATNLSFSGNGGASSYAWEITDGNGSIVGSTTSQFVNITAGASGSFTLKLTLTNGFGCPASITKVVTIKPVPTVNPVTPSAICSGSLTNIALTGTADASFSWTASLHSGNVTGFSGGMGATIAQTLTGSGVVKYSVTATLNGCPSAPVEILQTVNAQPTISNPSEQIVLQGGTATFSVTPGGTPTPTVQWFVSTDGGTTFTPLQGQTNATLTLANVTLAMNGNLYRAVADNGCQPATSTAARLTVNTLKVDVGDPLLCLSANGLVGVTATITNNNAAPVNASFTATLPTTLTGLPGTGLASINPGGINVTAAAVTWTGTVPANTTVIITYKAQVAAGTPANMPICIDSEVVFNGGPRGTVQECKVLGCPAGPVNVQVSDQKAGSLLVFPYYTSKASTKADTRMTISNIGENVATIHLFFIDGATCAQSDTFLCLTPNASFAFKASEFDAETTGWLLAFAVDQQGRPIQYNGLIGNAFVTDGEYVDNYGAESFRANSPLVATIADNRATLFFDNNSYDAVPNQLAVEIQSPVDAVGQKLVTVGLQGDLTQSRMTGAAQVGTGQLINGNEKPFGSFSAWLNGSCQAVGLISASTPRVPNGLSGMIPTGQVGTLRFNLGAGVGVLMTPRTTNWKGIRTLHKTGLTTTTITIPVVVPVC